MRRFIIRRTVFAVLTVLVATFLILAMSRLAGDPILLYAKPGGYGFTPEQEQILREKIGIDRAVPIQYVIWLGNALQGDLGRTILDEKPVSRIITERIPATLQLSLIAWIGATVIGVSLGVLSAVKRGSVWDYFGRGFALFGQALPAFWLGLVLILLFAVQWPVLPPAFRGDGVWDVKHWILPAITLGWGATAAYLRLTRSSMLEILDSEFIKLARAKGVGYGTVVWKHALRNALIQPLTASTLILTGFLTGSIVVEQIFVWPGMGLMAIESVNNNDFPVLQGITLMFTVMYVVFIFATDLLYAVIDPRIRYE